ncbi:hypothetical protein H7R52_00460 [Weissella confusa]|uniref:Uncharacterized protein n=1 Tax=Weissella confusa TaxID=1583 RepID=A0A923NER3_WEICO|nr:hypothetical protein [Weissella confusa]
MQTEKKSLSTNLIYFFGALGGLLFGYDTGAQVLAEMQKLASFTFVVGSNGESRFGTPKKASFVKTEKRPVF